MQSNTHQYLIVSGMPISIKHNNVSSTKKAAIFKRGTSKMSLGRGSYGEVHVRNGKAVKKFSKIAHLIQEYSALTYLYDCKYVVRTSDINLEDKELHMDLYDCSLRDWLINDPKPNIRDVMIIIHDVLMGLIELHDRGLAHGDIKPSNILVRKHPLGAVLGDCGFVSISKYAKLERTAPIYRDIKVGTDTSHDMYSFGICFLELIANIHFKQPPKTYDELKLMINKYVHNNHYHKLISMVVSENKEARPSARTVLEILFQQSVPEWNRSIIVRPTSQKRITDEDKEQIRTAMKEIAKAYKVRRPKRGYGALLSYIEYANVAESKYNLYIVVTLLILSAIFGQNGMLIINIHKIADEAYTYNEIYTALYKLLHDRVYMRTLLAL